MKLKKKQYYNHTYDIYDGRKIGFVTFQIQHKILMLKYLYVSPEYRNQRYGEKVIDYKNVRKTHTFRCGMDSTKIKK